MKRITILLLLLFQGILSFSFERVPSAWKWISDSKVAFSYDGSFTDSLCFSTDVRGWTEERGVRAPGRFAGFPFVPDGAVNLTFSPDSSMMAFTRDNDLYVVDVKTRRERRLTEDGSELVLNGYASWVYYEEIFGRPSRYKAFWWSEDSRRIAFYRFDNSEVPMFPIYKPDGLYGSLVRTRYPKAGDPNPKVRIGIVDLEKRHPKTVWADFNQDDDQYFGTPFWGTDGKSFYVPREPRRQNELDLYAVDATSGRKSVIYHETSDTSLEWITDMLFADGGIYMSRSFESGWEQIYYLSYDGKTLTRLTDGPNWEISLIGRNPSNGDIFFTAQRDSHTRRTLYRLDASGSVSALTDAALTVSNVVFSDDFSSFAAKLSNYTTPDKVMVCRVGGESRTVASAAGAGFDPSDYPLPQEIFLKLSCGLEVPGMIVFPVGFDPSKKYPVRMCVYGGPTTQYVRDRWMHPGEETMWFASNGIISVTVDVRSSGHNGREGLDQVYGHVSELETQDFAEWAEFFASLPYVMADRIGVEGFSFGGTMTALLVFGHPELFCCGIAGGGVYDWRLYDTHYTERYMDTPQHNPDGYSRTRVINHVPSYTGESRLMLTHGTADDNVHFQNTLQLVKELQKHGKQFDLMIYPDQLHGYRDAFRSYSWESDKVFWTKYLLNLQD